MQRARPSAVVRRAPSGLIATMATRIGGRIKAWRTRRALLALSDEQLKDIGLSRSVAHCEVVRRYRE